MSHLLSSLAPIHTARLCLRPLRAADAEAFRVMTDEPSILDAVHFLGRPFTTARAEDLLVGGNDGRDCFWGAYLRDGPALLGTVGTHLRGAGEIEVGYWFAAQARGRGLFDLAIDSKLRACDIVKIKIGDIVLGGRVRPRAIVVQQKTKRPVQFELLDHAQGSLNAWLECRGGAVTDYVFPSRINHAKPISTRQYARLVEEWINGIGLRREDYGTHSLRRTKAAMIYKQTGNLRAVQILLGHTKIESTVRYLGVDVEDALTLAERTEI